MPEVLYTCLTTAGPHRRRLTRKPWSEVQILRVHSQWRAMEGAGRSTAHQHRGRKLGSVCLQLGAVTLNLWILLSH